MFILTRFCHFRNSKLVYKYLKWFYTSNIHSRNIGWFQTLFSKTREIDLNSISDNVFHQNLGITRCFGQFYYEFIEKFIEKLAFSPHFVQNQPLYLTCYKKASQNIDVGRTKMNKK